MTKQILLIFLIFSTTFAVAQKKQKVKGSRVLTTETTSINDFERLVLSEKFEVRLVKGDSARIDAKP